MTCAATRRPGWRKLALATLTLFPIASALTAAPATNQADVHLRTDIDTMAVQIGQGAPLPPGGCNPGYTWHTTYGGCRIAQKQSESAQCPAGQTGTRERNRVAYALQANPGDIAYDGWSDWEEDCRPVAPTPAKACGFDVKKVHVLLDYTNPWSTQPSVFLVWDGAIVGSADSISSGSASIMSQWWHDFRKNGIVIGNYRYSMGNAVTVNSADTGIFDADDIFAYYELCREPVAVPPRPPPIVTFTVLKRPGGVSCRFTEFKVRANYPDEKAASGVKLKWSVIGRGALRTYDTVTDSRGEASVYATRFDGNMNIKVRVSFGASSQEIRGICIGGT